jgi:hypothetical protein
MTETTATTPTPTTATWTRWLYPALAITGIAVGIFIIVAGVYLVFFAHSGGYGSMHAPTDDCCSSMMKDMKMPMEQKPSMPSMSPMPSMPPMPNTPSPTPTP